MTEATVSGRASAATGLVARTEPIEGPPVDLVTVAGGAGYLFEQEGHGLAGRGIALRIPLPDGVAGDRSAVAATLTGIGGAAEEQAAPGCGPVAVGALPFDRTTPTSLVVPAVVVRRTADGRQWVTTVDRAGADGARPTEQLRSLLAAAEGAEAAGRLLPDGFSLTSPRPHPDWERTVADAVDAITAGRLDKVVIAREVLVEANRPIILPDVLDRLRTLYPACVVFCVEGFIGASPELLVERIGTAVRSHPLAGTYPRSGDPHADAVLAAELRASRKDQREHRFVIDQIERVLGEACASLSVPDAPTVMQLRNVLHLGTEIQGVLRDPPPSALELAAALHPTPAVGGTPSAEALAWLAEHEALSRGRYAGPVGWVDAGGDGAFAVGVRSAEVSGSRARLFAGVGIVEGSDPRRELIETQLKLQAILAAVVRP